MNKQEIPAGTPVNTNPYSNIISKNEDNFNLLDEVNPAFINIFEDRLFPVTIYRENSKSKKQVQFPTSWKTQLEFEDYDIVNPNTIACKTGEGLVVIDIDTKDLSHLESNAATIVKKLLDDKATFTVETTNGYHFYFDCDDTKYGNAVRVSEYIDIRGDGGCIFCYTNDPNSSYEVICDKEPLPLSDELLEYVKQKEPTQVTYKIKDGFKIADKSHDYNKDLYDAIRNKDIEYLLKSIGYRLDDFNSADKSGLYTKLNRLAFILAMNPACSNDNVKPIIEYIIVELCGFSLESNITKQKIYQIFSNMVYCEEESIEDIFDELYVPPTKLREMTVDSVPILGNFINKGDLSFIYGPPNSGKSLLLIHLLLKTSESVTYINADDNINQGTVKAEILESKGHMMIVCGSQSNNSPDKTLTLMTKAIDLSPNYYKDKIIIIDTVKKFVDVLNKANARKFLQLLRQITAVGGTVILLGHTNKHRNNNELVFEGVGDFISDVDCVYELDANTDNLAKEKTIMLTNKKLRGANPLSVAYSYSSSEEITTFEERLKSVKYLDDNELNRKIKENKNKELLFKYKDIHNLIFDYIKKNPLCSQTNIINYLKSHDDNPASEATIRKCINELSGIKWTFTFNKNNNNSKEFTIMTDFVFSYKGKTSHPSQT